MLELIRNLLADLVPERFVNDEKYRKWHLRVLNPVKGRVVLGVHIPDMKALAKSLARRSDALEIIRRFKVSHEADSLSLSYEEILVWGLMVNAVGQPWDVRKDLIRDFIPAIDNWCVCDTFCSNAGWGRDKARLWDFLDIYRHSGNEFEIRFAVVMSMLYLLDDEYFPQVCEWLDSLKPELVRSRYLHSRQASQPDLKAGMGIAVGESPYYVNMAVAWYLASALAKMPEQTRSYLETSSLSQTVRRLYVRKARESFRTRNIEPFNG